MAFLLKLETRIKENNSLLCVGLDPDIDRIPRHLMKQKDPLFEFNRQLVEATHDLVAAYKPQIAHYEKLGPRGLENLEKTANFVRKKYPEIPLILDAKRGDIGTTAEEYAKAVFDYYKFDAVTVNPYLGHDGLEPFFRRTDKGVIILCRTSNPGAKDFQDLEVYSSSEEQSDESRSNNTAMKQLRNNSSPQGRTIPLYMKVAEKIVAWNKLYGNCLMVVGATYPDEMKKIREIASDMFFLVPGIGAQGGDLEKMLAAGLRSDRSGLLIHSSRAIMYASDGPDFAEKARGEAMKLRDQINTHRT